MKSTTDILRREKMDTALPTLIDLFAATKKTEGRSNKTVSWYQQMLHRFHSFLGEDATIKDVTLPNARAFIAYLQEKTTRWEDHPISPTQEGGLSPHTIHAYVRTIKVFGSWLAEEGFVGVSPFLRLKRPRLPQPVIEILSDEEIETLIREINPNSRQGMRMYLTVMVLLDTGIRASELLGLKLEDIDMTNQQFKVRGKGNKERIVPFSQTVKKVFLRYVNTWRPETDDDQNDYLVLSMDGSRLTYSGLSHMIKRLGVSVGIPRLRAHLFRHTFAVKYLMNGGDVMTLKRILGHTDLQVTQAYMHLAEAHVQVQHGRFSPVERLNLKEINRRRRQKTTA